MIEDDPATKSFSFPVAVVPMAREKFKTHSFFLSRVDRPPLSFNPRKETMTV
jgi:hypothetical protein